MSLNEILIEFKAKAEGYKEQLRSIVSSNREVEQSAKKAEDAINSGFVTGADGAKRFEREVKRTVTTQAELELKLANLKTLLRDEARIGTETHRAIQREVVKTQKEIDKLDGKVKTQNDTFSRLGRTIAVAFSTQQLISFGKEVVDITRKTELLQNQLNFVAGSAEGGAIIFEKLKSESQRLGLNFEDLSKGYTGFAIASRQAGFSAQESLDIYMKLATGIRASGASSQQAERAFYALEQMMSKGKVSSEELRKQMGDALPGSVALAAKAVGVNTAEFNKMLETGQIISEDFIPKFAKVVEQEFAPALSGKTSSLDAAINRVNNEWNDLKRNMGDASFLTKAASTVSKVVERQNDLSDANISGFETLSRRLLEFMGLGSLNNDLINKTRALNAMKQLEDQRIHESAVRNAKAIMAMGQKEREQAEKDLNNQHQILQTQADLGIATRQQLVSLRRIIQTKAELINLEDKQASQNEANAADKAKQDAARQKALEDYIKTINAAFKEEQMMQADLQRQAEGYMNALKREQKQKAEIAAQDKKDRDDFNKQQQVKLDEMMSESDEQFKADQKRIKETKEAEKRALAERKAMYADFYNSVAGLGQALLNNELQRQRSETDARIRNLRQRFDAGLIAESEYNKQVLAIQREQFENEKRAARGQAIINGALAITNILSRWAANPPVAALLSAIAAGTTALQISTINKQTPGFEKGGYTGDKGTKQVAGVVHGQEFVSTAKHTKQHRGLLEAIHADKADDYIRTRYVLPQLLNSTKGGAFDDTGLRHDLRRLGKVSLKDETIQQLGSVIARKSMLSGIMQRRGL